MRNRGVRWIALTLGCLGAMAGSANGATYIVASCAASTSSRADAWIVTGGDAPRTSAGNACAGGTGGTDGRVELAGSLWFRPTLVGGGSPAGRIGGYRFVAPAGTSIRGIAYQRRLQTIDPVWRVALTDQDGASLGDECTLVGIQTSCPNSLGSFASPALRAGVDALEVAVYCQQAGCAYGVGPLYDFAIAIYSSEVTIEENVPPVVDAVGTLGGGGGYVGRQTRIVFSGSDTLGIRRFEILRDGQVGATIERPCVDWSVLPCSEPAAGLGASAGGSRTVGESGLYEGRQSVRIRATDGAGNTAESESVDLVVDTFPQEAVGVKGIGASRDAQRTVEWQVSGDGAPVASATARICTGAGPAPADCTESPIDPRGPLPVSLPGDGSSATVAITLTDAAGNTSTSPAHLLTRDTTAPPAPTLTLTGSNGAARTVLIGGEAGTTIRAAICPTTGGACTTLQPATAPATVGAALANPGTYVLKATLTDAAGNTSPQATLRLTRNATQSELRPFTVRSTLTTSRRTRRISLKGTVPRGATKRIDAKLTGRTSRGKLVTRKATIKVSANGRYSARIAFPKGATARRALKLTLTPRPAIGWRAASYRKTIRVK